jgi:ATP-dependent Clp protease adaptor protein ClpS
MNQHQHMAPSAPPNNAPRIWPRPPKLLNQIPKGTPAMNQDNPDLQLKTRPKIERPKLYKVILVNDDFTPREFVVRILKIEFRMNEGQAQQVMITAHQRGLCVVAVFLRDVAETKATRATDAARKEGYPLLFTIEPEE